MICNRSLLISCAIIVAFTQFCNVIKEPKRTLKKTLLTHANSP